MNYTNANRTKPIEPTFGPLVETCAAHGINRTTAFELAREGVIDSFLLKNRRFVMIDSLRTLPARMLLGDPRAAA